jgi:hypothetical protein
MDNSINKNISFLDRLGTFKPAVCAGAGSFVQCLCFYWCDIGKNRLQAGKTATFNDLKKYNGFTLSMIYVCISRGMGFGIMEGTRKIIKSKKRFDNLSDTKINIACATATAAIKPILLFPVETMKIQMQIKGKNSIKDAFISMKNLDNKLKLNSLGYLQIKNFCAYFSWFETRKNCRIFFRKYNHEYKNINTTLETFITGAVSSFVSFMCSSPFATLKTLRQVGVTKRFSDLVKTEGNFRMHRGLHFHLGNIIGGGGCFNVVYSYLMD